jgi:hypothetical protein
MEKQVRQFFFEKKNQKTFARCRRLVRDSRAKVFASLFKRSAFFPAQPDG